MMEDANNFPKTQEEQLEAMMFDRMGKFFCLDVNLAHQKFMAHFKDQDPMIRLLVQRSVYIAFIRGIDKIIDDNLKKVEMPTQPEEIVH